MLFRAAIDSDHALIIKGRLSQRQIENILYSFISKIILFSFEYLKWILF
jgi:hypothetical protein